jgi:hypothetical protein
VFDVYDEMLERWERQVAEILRQREPKSVMPAKHPVPFSGFPLPRE